MLLIKQILNPFYALKNLSHLETDANTDVSFLSTLLIAVFFYDT